MRDSVPDDRLPAEDDAQFDEDGRRYVFRFAPFERRQYVIDRERVFAYLKRHRLPGMGARSLIRDQRNVASFYEDVREIQTHADVEPVSKLTRLRSVS